MEPTPQVVVPLSPSCVNGCDEGVVSNTATFTFRPRYLLVSHQVARDFLILQFIVDDVPAFQWAPGQIPAEIFSGDCQPYLVRDVPSRIPLDQPVPLDLPICRAGQEISLRVRSISPHARNFSAVILGELVE